jgi:uncharacterized protein (DUF2062 family)
MWRGVGFIRQVKLMVVRFVRLRGLPDEIAKGVALGIFIGMTPTFGFQMAIAIFFAYILRENRLAAVLGVWVTNPVTAPFIYAAEYEVGHRLLGMERFELPSELTWQAYSTLGWEILFPMWFCSLLFGVIFGSIAYQSTLRLIPVVKTWRVPRWPRRHWHKKFKNRDTGHKASDDKKL